MKSFYNPVMFVGKLRFGLTQKLQKFFFYLGKIFIQSIWTALLEYQTNYLPAYILLETSCRSVARAMYLVVIPTSNVSGVSTTKYTTGKTVY